ncbi:hypothetical protein ACVW1C_002517 [Bradyrhizobium sp. USDA 4011]
MLGQIVRTATQENFMAETTKLSVEKALEKLRGRDRLKSKDQQLDEKTEALNEEVRRMRAQRLRLDQGKPKRG